MHFDAYRRRTTEAAASIGGRLITKNGGFTLEIELSTDDDHEFLRLALDRTDDLGWVVWAVDANGVGTCVDGCFIDLGWPPIAQLAHVARNAVDIHECS